MKTKQKHICLLYVTHYISIIYFHFIISYYFIRSTRKLCMYVEDLIVGEFIYFYSFEI